MKVLSIVFLAACAFASEPNCTRSDSNAGIVLAAGTFGVFAGGSYKFDNAKYFSVDGWGVLANGTTTYYIPLDAEWGRSIMNMAISARRSNTSLAVSPCANGASASDVLIHKAWL